MIIYIYIINVGNVFVHLTVNKLINILEITLGDMPKLYVELCYVGIANMWPWDTFIYSNDTFAIECYQFHKCGCTPFFFTLLNPYPKKLRFFF